ncbi:hypothetical protein A2U01_0005625 [Trifolium medium]|uniref:Uncharacterized protein n=1 Tax=Trifolium medium TaxID=97028 RepID=A0A392MCK3_9FABA|nr:hypothetical protein [Trifolium medium]
MASSSQINNDGDDHIATVQTSPHREHDTVISPVRDNEKLVPETDPRDGRETSFSSEDGDVPVLTERQSGKHPQMTQEISVDTAQPTTSVTNTELAAVIAALKQTTEALQSQSCRLDEQNLRLEALERSQRPQRNNSPPQRRHASQSPPRQETVKQRPPALERIEQPNKKRDRTPPLREGRASSSKKGKAVDRHDQRRHSPQGLALMARQGASASRGNRGDRRGNRGDHSPTPPWHDDTSLQSPTGSDEDDAQCPLSEHHESAYSPGVRETSPARCL